jgi:hypothetical protein
MSYIIRDAVFSIPENLCLNISQNVAILVLLAILPSLFAVCVRISKNNYVVLVRERTIPTERPPLVGDVSAQFCE